MGDKEHKRQLHNIAGKMALCLLLLLLILNQGASCAQTSRTQASPIIPAWPSAPDAPFTLPAQKIDGSAFDLAQHPGWKVLYFWSASCPCVRACEQYTLRPLTEKYGTRVAFYAIVSGRYELTMPRAQLKSLVQDHNLPFPVLLDLNHVIATTLGAEVTPQTFLLDPTNHVVFSGMPDDTRRYLHATGRSGATVSYLSQALSEAMAGKKVTRPFVENEGCIIGF